jgi:hypothetical protein
MIWNLIGTMFNIALVFDQCRSTLVELLEGQKALRDSAVSTKEPYNNIYRLVLLLLRRLDIAGSGFMPRFIDFTIALMFLTITLQMN